MPINPLLIVGSLDILSQGQKAIAAVLPDFAEKKLQDDSVRSLIVQAADKYLTTQFKPAKLIPEETRKKHLRMMLDMALDDLILPPNP